MEVNSYHTNNDNRHIKFVIHYTVLNVYPWFCVNCIQYSINMNIYAFKHNIQVCVIKKKTLQGSEKD